MNFENLRAELPPVGVYIQDEDRSLLPASQTLADDVRADLSQTRARMVEQFGQQSMPPMDAELQTDVAAYFSERRWSLPQSVVIDPVIDATTLRAVLHGAAFPSTSDEEFFTGLNGQTISPGGSPQRDIVIFHDWRSKYRQEIRELVTGWEYSITDESLESAAELKVADFVVHELSHLAGRLAVTAVVVEKIEGKYHLADRCMSGFTDIRDDIPAPELDDDSNYYTGPALDESWAALNASRFVLAHACAEDRNKLAIPDRYGVLASIKDEDGNSLDYSVAVLHSEDAGIIIEKLNELYPGVIVLMTDVANGVTDLTSVVDNLKTILPQDIIALLNKPQYSAWQDLRKRLDI